MNGGVYAPLAVGRGKLIKEINRRMRLFNRNVRAGGKVTELYKAYRWLVVALQAYYGSNRKGARRIMAMWRRIAGHPSLARFIQGKRAEIQRGARARRRGSAI